MALNLSVLHTDSRAKYAVIFLIISRSILTSASSALKCANSIYSVHTGLAPAPEAKTSIMQYMDWYNRSRPHSNLGKKAPDEAYAVMLPTVKLAA